MDEEQRKLKIATWLKWVGGIGALVVSAPFIFIALKAALGLGALAVVAGVGFVTIKLTPYVSMKISNNVVRLMMGEAKKNPIETMINLLASKAKELEAADAAIVEFETEVLNYDESARDFAKRYPDEAPAYQEVSRRMHEALEEQKRQQEEARRGLDDFKQKIAKAQAIYEMSLATAQVTKFSKSAETKVFDEIKEKVAFKAVTSSLNRSFAQLGMALAKRQQITAEAPKALKEATS